MTAVIVHLQCKQASAGINNDADTPLTAEMVAHADIFVVMERVHRTKLRQRFRAVLKSTRIVCLDIPDRGEFMDPALVRLLDERVTRHLP